MTMKNRVPPNAAKQTERDSNMHPEFPASPGSVFAISPETNSGNPNIDGANEEIDCASETHDTIQSPQCYKQYHTQL